MKQIKLLSILLLVLAVAFLQVSCKGECKVKVDSKGNGSGECSLSSEFSPKPTKYDPLVVIDLNKNYLIGDRITVNVKYKTDRNFSRSGTFYIRRDVSKRSAPVLAKAQAYSFVPENKAAMEVFFKEALANTTHLITETVTFKFSVKAKDAKLTTLALGSGEVGIRGRLPLNGDLQTFPLSCCR